MFQHWVFQCSIPAGRTNSPKLMVMILSNSLFRLSRQKLQFCRGKKNSTLVEFFFYQKKYNIVCQNQHFFSSIIQPCPPTNQSYIFLLSYIIYRNILIECLRKVIHNDISTFIIKSHSLFSKCYLVGVKAFPSVEPQLNNSFKMTLSLAYLLYKSQNFIYASK